MGGLSNPRVTCLKVLLVLLNEHVVHPLLELSLLFRDVADRDTFDVDVQLGIFTQKEF